MCMYIYIYILDSSAALRAASNLSNFEITIITMFIPIVVGCRHRHHGSR